MDEWKQFNPLFELVVVNDCSKEVKQIPFLLKEVCYPLREMLPSIYTVTDDQNII
jgi:hypothetical protein